MKIEIAGIVHNDPLGKGRLRNWLENRKGRFGKPDFIGLEWDEYHLKQVVNQRFAFSKLAKAEWPQASDEFLETLAASLGYEGDTHREVFDTVPELWLDEGRDLPYEDAIQSYSADKIRFFKRLITKLENNFDEEGLAKISIATWKISEIAENGTDRDRRFFEKVHTSFNTSQQGWGIIVAGANHASINIPDNLINLLQAAGFDCSSEFLSPN